MLNSPEDREIHPLPLEPEWINAHGWQQCEQRLRRIVRNVRFEILHDECAFRVLGPDMPYYGLDPFLIPALREFGAGLLAGDLPDFHESRRAFDLCFEDSWSGYFLADFVGSLPKGQPVVLIHLDDHTDMMSTLLEDQGDRLVDPIAGETFHPVEARSWQRAIASGGVGIGCFVTPFFFCAHRLHVIHLNNVRNSSYLTYPVFRHAQRYDLIPGKGFAALRKRPINRGPGHGTYTGGRDAATLLRDIPSGDVVVHIDLDYFINDFNGNPLEGEFEPDFDRRLVAEQRMNDFFGALRQAHVSVLRWIVATSPGFCSACHWQWLLSSLEERITDLD